MSMPHWQARPLLRPAKTGGAKKTPRSPEPSTSQFVSLPYGFFDDIVIFNRMTRNDELTTRAFPANTGRLA
ncbi:hypothetical protein [Sphingobium lactosutens]|nr:hypothetical protein [Sphingobium lactosutens]